MFGAIIKIMWEEQLIDPPFDQLTISMENHQLSTLEKLTPGQGRFQKNYGDFFGRLQYAQLPTFTNPTLVEFMIPRTLKSLINTQTESPYFTKYHFLVLYSNYGKLLPLSNTLSAFKVTQLFDPDKFNKLNVTLCHCVEH